MKVLTKEEIIKQAEKDSDIALFAPIIAAVAYLFAMNILTRVNMFSRPVEITICVVIFILFVLPFVKKNMQAIFGVKNVEAGKFYIDLDKVKKKEAFQDSFQNERGYYSDKKMSYSFRFANYRNGRQNFIKKEEYDRLEQGDYFYMVYAKPFKTMVAYFPCKEWAPDEEIKSHFKGGMG